MPSAACRDVALHAPELVTGSLEESVATDLRGHVAQCGECARTVARQRRLESLLGSLPPAPVVEVAAPALPRPESGRVVVLRRVRWAAAAAVLAAASAWVATHQRRIADDGAVRVARVVETSQLPP